MQMFFIFLWLLAVAIPYGVERFYFREKLGFFAVLFWIFVFQCSIVLGGLIIFENQLGQSLPDWVKSIGNGILGLSFITIGFAPITAVLVALVAMIVIAAKWFRRKSAESSD